MNILTVTHAEDGDVDANAVQSTFTIGRAVRSTLIMIMPVAMPPLRTHARASLLPASPTSLFSLALSLFRFVFDAGGVSSRSLAAPPCLLSILKSSLSSPYSTAVSWGVSDPTRFLSLFSNPPLLAHTVTPPAAARAARLTAHTYTVHRSIKHIQFNFHFSTL